MIESTATNEILTLKQFIPAKDKLFLIFRNPTLRPPVLEEMMSDINCVISKIAHKYTDQSCPQLHYDELMSQGHAKLAALITKGFLDPGHPKYLPTRTDFFKFFKATVNNHIKGLVHKWRFTIKRTGIRAPERGAVHFESTKPIEISLDDPEANLQVGESFDDAAVYESELTEQIKAILTPLELIVLNQMLSPNDVAATYAMVESYRGKKPGSEKVDIKVAQQAIGLGMSVELYQDVRKQIEIKVRNLMEHPETDQDIKYNAAVRALSQSFTVQVPRNIDKMVVRRLFTMLARNNYTRVTDEVTTFLNVVGAKVPELHNGSTVLSCFGVLYQKTDPRCMNCGLQVSCRTEAANYGLGEITFSPKLLHANKQVRIPAIIPRSSLGSPLISSSRIDETVIEDNDERDDLIPVMNSSRDEEIFNYLSDNFRRTKYDGSIYFKHKDALPSKKVKFIFWVGSGQDGGPLKLRFCKPSEGMNELLVRRKNGQYLPDHISASESIVLIDRHAKETFN